MALKQGASLITLVGIVSGEVLACIERRGRTTLRGLTRELGRPSTLVLMAVGALIRQGLVRGSHGGADTVLEAAALA